MAYSALDIAKAFLNRSNPEYGEVISNLKLQKLLYYAQGLHLAMYDEPLFDEKIWAWDYGPVVEEVYRTYRDHNANAIDIPNDFDEERALDNDTKQFLDEVYEAVGQFSAIKLMNMTHNETPWNQSYKNGEISLESLKEFFKDWVKEDDEQ
jgi:uncharacterized phage-associated protein